VRQEFELQVQDFLAERRITGVETPVTEEVKVLVAASAAILSTGWMGFRWGQVIEVLVYPHVFNADDYGFVTADTAGQAHPWGIVILSLPTLVVSFDHPVEASHVGIHEFAHVLDLESGDFDGVPLGFGRQRIRAWERLRRREERRIQRGHSELRPYALTNRVEFLAVAAEVFFQKPAELRRSSPDLYRLLRDYFQQDPAKWEGEAAVSTPPHQGPEHVPTREADPRVPEQRRKPADLAPRPRRIRRTGGSTS
jgi:Mlc titration factor MtfA (ptsG expression regulator)